MPFWFGQRSSMSAIEAFESGGGLNGWAISCLSDSMLCLASAYLITFTPIHPMLAGIEWYPGLMWKAVVLQVCISYATPGWHMDRSDAAGL